MSGAISASSLAVPESTFSNYAGLCVARSLKHSRALGSIYSSEDIQHASSINRASLHARLSPNEVESFVLEARSKLQFLRYTFKMQLPFARVVSQRCEVSLRIQ